MVPSRQISTFVWGCLLAIASSGCGSGVDRPELGYVSGTVTMDGEPVPNVIVVMKPEKGRSAMVRTDKDGHYEMEYTEGEKGTKVGPTTVTLEWPLGEDGGFAIPSKYTMAKSEVKFEVKSGQQTYDIKMESEGGEAKKDDAQPTGRRGRRNTAPGRNVPVD